ncbi:putative transmembrane sensor [Vibrio sinaloensis DSM 21326]|uniref:Putative transmembrane sensor n=1 Tax=Vibrio sinaloensis DSM 21326 TaxID=945550 RepID=E8M5Q2_PHOS4|nr:FecR domain-containing protein [Vibrio sinaloensis]EGA70624.1 putative transmembrane sensor [Vibrio sinaloensis DSM 21326]
MDPISRDSIEQASLWMARLWADDVTQQDRDAFHCWKSAAPENAKAWEKLELVQQKFARVPQSNLSRRVLATNKNGISRRQMLMLGGVSFASLGLGLSAYRPAPQGAEFATVTGEMKALTLADGTQLALNTDTTVYVNFNHQRRELYLSHGEILVTNSHHTTPLHVATSQGRVRPIGTRFAVREFDASTQVCVYEGEVELQPLLGLGSPHLLAGEYAHFNRRSVASIEKNQTHDALWLEQKIQAQATPLTEFIQELARYRKGILSIDPSLKTLKLTGVFSTENIDRTLYNISQILPIELHYRTPLWVTIKARS